jgi:transcriptional regulator with XRE-family HTH domain
VERPSTVDLRLGKRLKTARDGKNLSQAELAKLLALKGIRVYGSTIAKIEAGSRPVKATELAAFVDLLGVDADTLLGYEKKPRSELVFALMSTADTAVKGSSEVVKIMSALRDRITDLSNLDELPVRDALTASAERAYDLLLAANGVLTVEVSKVARDSVGKELKATGPVQVSVKKRTR